VGKISELFCTDELGKSYDLSQGRDKIREGKMNQSFAPSAKFYSTEYQGVSHTKP